MTMHSWMLFPLLSLALVSTASATAPDNSEVVIEHELTKLEGVWRVKEHTIDGNETPKERLETIPWAEITIEGDTLQMSGARFRIAIDPAKGPKSIDRRHKDADGKDVTIQGIYELSGNTLKLCFPKMNGDRPMKLKAVKEVVTVVYDRKME